MAEELDPEKWVFDANGNRCSIAYWGSREEAQKRLDRLKNCTRCTDCSDCTDCSRCSRCLRCSRCSDCSDCKNAAFLLSKKNAQSVPGETGRPPIPVIPDIHKRVYEAVSNPNALKMDTWHTCNTTHCRGGWVVTLAGEAGKKLEAFHDTLLAAMLIYDASDPDYRINPGRFFDSNEAALADMKALAEK